MAENLDMTGRIEGPEVAVVVDRTVHAAALRYFDADALSDRLRGRLGEELPAALRVRRGALAATGDPFLLVWRSPTESWLLAAAAAPIDAVRALFADAADACVVVQTGGILALHVTGRRTPELLRRLGSAASIPAPGEAKTGRFADVTVTAVGLAADETLLLVDRTLAEHVREWIRASLGDL
jgi:sarcosine oxidase gamma subunit